MASPRSASYTCPSPVRFKETRNASYVENDEGDRRLNQYIMKETLGRGAFGVVTLAQDADTAREFAIKEFSKTRLRKQEMFKANGFGRGRGRGRGMSAMKQPDSPFEYIKGEIAVMKKLNHPNILKLFEVLDDPTGDSLYMVFELCDKPVMDIGMEHDTEPYTEAQARSIFGEAVLGLEYLHEHGIAHRDIKPDNLLRGKDGFIKFVDFGVSEMFEPGQDRSKKSAGSPAFFSPEMCTAQHGEMSTKACDIWALGVTLHCLCFGKLPFVGHTILELYENIRTLQLEIPECSPELKDLLTKMMMKDPKQRITLSEIRQSSQEKDHPWTTNNGKEPLLSRAENLGQNMVESITEEELRTAIKPLSLRSLATVLKAVAKLKRLGSGALSRSQSASPSSVGLSTTAALAQLSLQPASSPVLAPHASRFQDAVDVGLLSQTSQLSDVSPLPSAAPTPDIASQQAASK